MLCNCGLCFQNIVTTRAGTSARSKLGTGGASTIHTPPPALKLPLTPLLCAFTCSRRFLSRSEDMCGFEEWVSPELHASSFSSQPCLDGARDPGQLAAPGG